VREGAALLRRNKLAGRPEARAGQLIPSIPSKPSHQTRAPTGLPGHVQVPVAPWLERTHQNEQLSVPTFFCSSISLGGRRLGKLRGGASIGQKETIFRKDTVASDRCPPMVPPISCESPRDGLRRGTPGTVGVRIYGGSGDHSIL
jgi:hypothetical protein